MLPLVDAILFSSIGVAFGETDQAVEILVVGILLFHVIWQLTLAGSLGFLEEVWSRNVLNLWTTPLTEAEYGLALLVAGFVRALVSMGLVGAVAAGLYAVDPTGAGWVLAIGAATLMVFGWAVAMLVVGLVLQFGETAEVFSWGTLVLLMPLSGIFYPPEALPGVLQPLAQVIPLTRIFEATRQSLIDGTVRWVDLGLGAPARWSASPSAPGSSGASSAASASRAGSPASPERRSCSALQVEERRRHAHVVDHVVASEPDRACTDCPGVTATAYGSRGWAAELRRRSRAAQPSSTSRSRAANSSGLPA